MAQESAESSPSYAAPAVEKALDVLEFLAGANGPVSQNQIAQETGRSVAQIFRVLSVLERRGYIARDADSNLYTLTMMLFDVAHRHEPLRSLVWLATPAMRTLARTVEQSCNLGIRDGDEIVIIAQADSPSDFGFRVRAGATFPLIGPSSGELLLAFELPEAMRTPGTDRDARLAEIRRNGYAEQSDQLYPGVIDMAFPILRKDGSAVAALTVPYVATSYSPFRREFVRDELSNTARRISSLLSGHQEPGL
ncbi:MAG TPA: IclR family transcriptional regulator [Glaciibacter sp.]|nr:IclR family transcriptional regulator [Glaciibacter sp.]